MVIKMLKNTINNKNKFNYKKIPFIYIAISLSFFLFYITGVIIINLKYPQSINNTQTSENALLSNGLTLEFAEIYFLDDEEIYNDEFIMQSIGINQKEEISDFKVMLVQTSLVNNSGYQQILDLTSVAFEIDTYSNQVFLPLMEYMNDESMFVLFEENEQKELVLPIVMYKKSFDKGNFDTLSIENNVNMVFSLYPIKNVISIKK